MTRLAVLIFSLMASHASLAQYHGPAVDTCLAYAKREAAREGARPKDIVFERDQNLMIERYARKLGSQFVSSILRGNGAVVLDGTPSAELSFICLLANDKQAVFFDWLPRLNPSALAQCTRDENLRGDRSDPGLCAAVPGSPRARSQHRQRSCGRCLSQGQRRVAPVPRCRVRAAPRRSGQKRGA
jgi:hypothetical protein